MGKCIYCKSEIGDCVVDVCRRCGVGVWGEKMFQAILDNMKIEKGKGNMELGRVGESEIKRDIFIERRTEIIIEDMDGAGEICVEQPSNLDDLSLI